MVEISADIAIIGSGPGGSALAYRLKDCGAKVVVVERGGYLPIEPANWDAEAVFSHGRYKTSEQWFDVVNGTSYRPGNHYWVGGQTKMYGANLQRFRKEDFDDLEHVDGVSPAWPIAYENIEPYYGEAESLFAVRGEAGVDPTEPYRSSPFPFPAIPHEPAVALLVEKLNASGFKPHPLEMAVHWEGAGCNAEFPCSGCDGFPCYAKGKADAETQCLRPALESKQVELLSNTLINRFTTTPNGKQIVAAEGTRRGESIAIKSKMFVLACGAANSPLVLLRSHSSAWPDGIGNTYDQVGRYYMLQNQSALMSVRPFGTTDLTMQKTVGIHDFLFEAPGFYYPAGAIQTLGKLTGLMIQSDQPYLPSKLLDGMVKRSIDWWMTSEELPDPNNRIQLGKDGRIEVTWRPNNEQAHKVLLTHVKKMMRGAGYPFNFHKRFGIAANAHQCGTLRLGNEPSTSVCDPSGRVHGVENLYVADASVFPSSTAMAPTLTLVALSLKMGHVLAAGR
ncbi:MAG: GMC family oxidoreductase [Rhodothermaceae bacterium]|nr:GMC family oxidoreductase [Rhodothermaceae bacterium]